MSKKGFWKFIALALVIAAAVAGCIFYLSRYKDFTKSLDEDLDDFEEEDDTSTAEDEEASQTSSPVRREYVSIPFEQSPAN